MYGLEITLDLYGCDPKTFTRTGIKGWLEELCRTIDMNREDLHFWDYQSMPKRQIPDDMDLAGTSAVQFLTASNITIHTLDLLGECYINIFTRNATFNIKAMADFTGSWFKAKNYECRMMERGKESKA